ncbi:solute carrier family 22 member 21 isoform X1, partial [Biomphalaria glabrata]
MLSQTEIVDVLLASLDWNGFYQKSRCAVCLMSVIVFVLHLMSVVFLGKSVKHQCRLPVSLNVTIDDVIHDVWTADNVSLYNVTLGECTVEMNNGSHVIFTSHCVEGYTYNDDDQSSFVTEWDLVCNDQYLSDVSQIVYVGGQMFGSLFFTRFADTHGRKKVLTVTSLLFQVCTLACSFPPNFTVYLVLKFACGAVIACSYQVSVILMLELLPKERRAIVEQLKTFLWSTSLLFLCFIAYVTRQLSWHYTQLTLSLISLYVVVLWWVTDESLPWLFAANKLKEAEVLLQKIARINKVNYEKVSNILKNNFVQFESYASPDTQLSGAGQGGDGTKKAKQEDHVMVFLKNRHLLKLTLISSFLSFTVTMVYEGLLMMSPNLTEDFYLGFVLGVVTEFPATVLFSFLINRVGRKKCIYIFQILAGVLLLVSTVLSNTPLSDNIPGRYWVSLVTSLIGRLAFSVSYSSVVLYVTELFPTSVRNTGCGIAGVGTYFGSMIAPYARSLSRRLPLVPTTIIGLLCLVVPFTILNLPETNGRELAHTLEDLERVMTVKATRPKPFCRRLFPCWYSKHAVVNNTHNEVSVHVVHIESSTSCIFQTSHKFINTESSSS